MLVIFLLAGCATPPAGTPDAPGGDAPDAARGAVPDVPDIVVGLVQDAVGDAQEFTSEAVAENGDRQADWGCGVARPWLPQARDTCDTQVPPDDERPKAGGVPAPPPLDLVGVEWIERAETVTVSFLTAGWDGQWASLLPRPGAAVSYQWSWTNGTCTGNFIAAIVDLGGGVDIRSYYQAVGPGCRHFVGGTFSAMAGAPARFNVTFAWRDLPWDGPAALPAARGTVVRDEAAGTFAYFSVRGSPLQTPQDNLDFAGYVADATDPVDPFLVVRGPPAGLPPPAPKPLLEDQQGTDTNARPDLDATRLELLDTPTNLTIRIHIDRVDAQPDDLALQMQFDGHPDASGASNIYILDAEASQGAWTLGAHKLALPDLHVEPLPANATFVAGAPGYLQWVFDRNELEPFAAGDLLGRAVAQMASPAARRSESLAAGESYYASASVQVYDGLYGHLRLSVGPPVGAEALSIDVSDGAGDVVLPPEAAVTFSSPQADILNAEFRYDTPTLARATIALSELAQPHPPTGFTALFYGIALQQPDGRTIVIGYYQPEAVQDPTYFCGVDRTILADIQGDPIAGLVRHIQGAVKQGGVESGGIIQFEVPVAECFGVLDSDASFRVDVARMRAGSYLLRETNGVLSEQAVETMDTADTEEPRSVTFRDPRLVEATFWQKPFGIDNFWDIFAVVATGLGAAIGGILVLFRRSRLNHYLRRIEAARRQPLEEREATLATVAVRLERDLLRHRIPTDHYAIVESRLDPLLARTRASLLAAEFPRLPETMLTRAEELMADGELSQQDTARLLALARGLDAQQAKALARRLGAWSA